MDSGIDLWKKAKRIIPGGSQLLSKQSEQFLPEFWPSYYKKAKGVKIWDLNNNLYLDMSLMGVGSCVLGYADADVNKAVKEAIDAGSMSTLNCPEEVELAELLLRLNKWAEMVRYARTGGEAMTVAVRIARTFTGKEKLAFCGYHGWHDWYLSANLDDDKNLDGHLLPGLEPLGVPRTLKGTSFPFEYNRIDQLEEIIEKEDIGTIVLEPIRHYPPENNFLKKVRKLADEIGVVLIFDEISSAWRMNIGGTHQLFNVNPDIIVYGKAMSNGFPMAAILGKGEVMNAAQNSFISSTYWTDRVGPAASIATIEKMIKNNVPNKICKTGKMISKDLINISSEIGLEINIIDVIPSLIKFEFNYDGKDQLLSTIFTQEMLKRRFLASKNIYVSFSHKENHINQYNESVREVFEFLYSSLKKGDIKNLLQGPIAHDSFKRLN